MDKVLNDFLENIKALAFDKHLEVESIKNSAKLERLMSKSGKFSLNTFFKLVYLNICLLKVQ